MACGGGDLLLEVLRRAAALPAWGSVFPMFGVGCGCNGDGVAGLVDGGVWFAAGSSCCSPCSAEF